MTSIPLFLRLLAATGLALLGTTAGHAASPRGNGGISLSQTRVIFNADDKTQTLMVKNTSNRAFLVQSRALLAQGDSAGAPFTITPPLFTLAPNSRQVLRILPQNATLSDTQESLFHLSVLAIPAGSAPTEGPLQVSTAMRFGLKLFYRPASLDAPSESQGCRLRFSQSAQGVRIENPTPYYQTLGKLSAGNTPVNLTPTTSMLPPGGSQTLPDRAASNEMTWQTITDYGALSERCRAVLTDKTEST